MSCGSLARRSQRVQCRNGDESVLRRLGTLAKPIGLGPAMALSLAVTLVLAACAGDEPSPAPATEEATMTLPAIAATNAFYYYRDLDSAWEFYTRVLGLETVADFGFAKILRVAPSSYLTLVDQEEGMHSADDPKSVTLALVTQEVEEWWAYLSGLNVPMRAPLGEVDLDRAHNGFVAVDPEGYLLEFERFNPHEENTELLPRLGAVEPLGPAPGVETTRPGELRVQATVFWLYYHDIDAALAWYEDVLGTRLLVDQGWAKVVPVSATGYLGFVDGTRGLHQATEEKAVTVSFFTHDVDGWFDVLGSRTDVPLRTPEITGVADRVRTFVGYDPEGYFLEWDTFREVEENRRLLAYLDRP
jgi:catechol 2,3-dioxygenase-like lactoylglutathione lyase family enzyme